MISNFIYLEKYPGEVEHCGKKPNEDIVQPNKDDESPSKWIKPETRYKTTDAKTNL